MPTIEENLIKALAKEYSYNSFLGIDTTGQTVSPDKTFNWTTEEMINIFRNPNTNEELKNIIQGRIDTRGTRDEDIANYQPGQFESYTTSILEEPFESSYNVKIKFNPLDDVLVTSRREPLYDKENFNKQQLGSNKAKAQKKKSYRGQIIGIDGKDTGYRIVGNIGKVTSGKDHPIESPNYNPSNSVDYGDASTFKIEANKGSRVGKQGFEVTTPKGTVVYIDRKDLEVFLKNIGAM